RLPTCYLPLIQNHRRLDMVAGFANALGLSMVNTTESTQPAVLLYADSESSADLLYFGRFFVPDAMIALGVNDRKIGVLNSLEYSRGLKESAFDEIIPYEELYAQAKQQ